MKTRTIFRNAALWLLLVPSISSCIEETFPQSGTATAQQVAESPAAQMGQINAIVNFVNAYNAYGQYYSFDFGYSAFGITRDVMCEDFYVYDAYYDYFSSFGRCRNLSASSMGNAIYYYYYKFLNNTNNLLRVVDEATAGETSKRYIGIAKTFRAMIYMDMARFYEYKKTGIAKLDDEARENGVYGLTVPIVTEQTTETDARNNPRAPFYTMYKFILDDLESAGALLNDYVRPRKNLPDKAVVNGLKARLWLEIATRTEKSPEDLSAIKEHVSQEVTSAADCYAKAARYAREAIDQSGAIPLTEEEWFGGKDYTTAFNSIGSASWIWGSMLTKDNLYSDYVNFIGMISPEQNFGVGNYYYWAIRTISSRLFEQIADDDWRKATWIAPKDAGQLPGKKYRTILPPNYFTYLPAYTNLKFKPKEGNVDDYKIGAVVDYPLMRVEEMYFIEAEAIAGSRGVAEGVASLQSFMQTYRYASYTCTAGTMDEFRQALMLQKRIEFWGEGIIYWDYKRLNLSVTRGYPGTNCPVGFRLNSIEGYCAPWFTLYFSKFESNQNKAIVLNPDPSAAIPEWEE
ncbi:RagB/SusD family nutrient uptake outer membrane protein [Bacteroides heparinolyticus]|uniref:RagB/SusD family nutrient uptake outer membrane protein n=1 Tax=Prevotella heparinolytica TaxID=28113 RepID=UPI0035A11B96